MSVFYQLTFVCDACGQEYMVDSDVPSMPPHWIAMQLILSDKDGDNPEGNMDSYIHFCCQDCMALYSSSNHLKERLLMVDQAYDEDEDDDEDFEPPPPGEDK